MDFTLPPQNLVKGRADFSSAEFRKLIAQKGIDLEWSQSAMCPCSVETGELNLDLNNVGEEFSAHQSLECPQCGGSGKYYHSPQVIRAVVQGADSDFINARFGGYKDGVISISMNPEHLASHGDRFKMVDSVLLFKEVLKYAGEALTSARFPIEKRDMTLASGEVSVGVIYCSYADPTDYLASGVELVEGVDFTIDAGSISWVNPPPNGARVTISYYAQPSYICVGFPHSVRDSRSFKKSTSDFPTILPVQIQAKLEFLEGE